MFPLIEFPELVQHYAPYFADVFSAEAFIQFKRYHQWLDRVGEQDLCWTRRRIAMSGRTTWSTCTTAMMTRTIPRVFGDDFRFGHRLKWQLGASRPSAAAVIVFALTSLAGPPAQGSRPRGPWAWHQRIARRRSFHHSAG